MPLEAEPLQPGLRRGAARLARAFVELEAERHIVQRAAPRHQPVALEDDADLAAKPVELVIGIVPHHPHAARGRADQPGDQVEGGRLAAAGGTEDGEELAGLDREAEIAHGMELALGAGAALEALGDAVEHDRRAHSPRSASGR